MMACRVDGFGLLGLAAKLHGGWQSHAVFSVGVPSADGKPSLRRLAGGSHAPRRVPGWFIPGMPHSGGATGTYSGYHITSRTTRAASSRLRRRPRWFSEAYTTTSVAIARLTSRSSLWSG